ncbi:hypothetical protein [Mycobacterium kiyosense]|nr:hypothetical protein IWGMT90018_44560 [Mycobacterium kiyosense]
MHTPLGWSIWGGLTEQVLSEVVVALGAWPRPPDVSDVNRRFGCIFYGRYAANVNTFRAFGDRMPGTSGDAVEAQFFRGQDVARAQSAGTSPVSDRGREDAPECDSDSPAGGCVPGRQLCVVDESGL